MKKGGRLLKLAAFTLFAFSVLGGYFIYPKSAAAATQYKLSSDKKTITTSNGKTFTYDPSGNCGYDAKGTALDCATSTNISYRGFSGSALGWPNYTYISLHVANIDAIHYSDQTIGGSYVVVQSRWPLSDSVSSTDITVQPPATLPKQPTDPKDTNKYAKYTYAWTQDTISLAQKITSSDKRLFNAADLPTALSTKYFPAGGLPTLSNKNMVQPFYKSSDGWSVVFTGAYPGLTAPQSTRGLLLDNTGTEIANITITGAPNGSLTIVPGVIKKISGVIYVDQKKPGNEVNGPIHVNIRCTCMANAIDVVVDSRTGRFSYEYDQLTNGVYYIDTDQKIDTTKDDFKDFISKWGYLLGKTDVYLTGISEVSVDRNGNIKNTTLNDNSWDVVVKKDTRTTDPIVDASDKILNAVNWMIENGPLKWATQIIDYTNKMGAEGDSGGIQDAWKAVRNLGLSLLTLALIIIAFMNVASIDLERFGLDKMIPRLIIGIVFTYFSWLIARALLEVSSALQILLYRSDNVLNNSLIPTPGSNDLGAKILCIILGVAILLVLLYLCIILLVRLLLIWYLVILAPFAFMMNILPFTEFLYKMWWDWWWKWLFMGPATLFFLWVASQIINAYKGTGIIDATILVLLAAISIGIAATIPLQLGGKVVDFVNKHTPGLSHGLEYAKQRGAQAEQRKQRGVARFRAGLGRTPVVGGMLSGNNRRQQLENELAVVAEDRKSMMNMSDDDVQRGLLNSHGLRQRAFAMEMADRGKIGLDPTKSGDRRVMEVMSRYATTNRAINDLIGQKQPEAYAAFANAGLRKGARDTWNGDATKGLQKVSNGSYHPEQMRFVVRSINQALADGDPARAAAYANPVNRLLNDQNRLNRVLQVGDERTLATLGEYMLQTGTAAGDPTQDAQLRAAANDHATKNGGARVFAP